MVLYKRMLEVFTNAWRRGGKPKPLYFVVCCMLLPFVYALPVSCSWKGSQHSLRTHEKDLMWTSSSHTAKCLNWNKPCIIPGNSAQHSAAISGIRGENIISDGSHMFDAC